MNLEAVDAILVHALCSGQAKEYVEADKEIRTWGGPRMVPFQLLMSRSSPSSRPYEQASGQS